MSDSEAVDLDGCTGGVVFGLLPEVFRYSSEGENPLSYFVIERHFFFFVPFILKESEAGPVLAGRTPSTGLIRNSGTALRVWPLFLS